MKQLRKESFTMIDLSLCMITKNEEKYLEGCLNSVKDVVNEIIIVDTGSTDRTLEIAESFEANIIKIEWPESFAKARNVSIANAFGKWILYLDADERLTEESKPELLRLTQSDENIVYSLAIRNYYRIFKEHDTFNAYRLFKNDPGLYFINAVHEQIINSALKLGFQAKKSICEISHIGYDVENQVIQDKAKRNLHLLLSENEFNRDPIKCYQIAQCYGMIGDIELSRDFLVRVTSFGKSKMPYYYWDQTVKSLKKMRDLENA